MDKGLCFFPHTQSFNVLNCNFNREFIRQEKIEAIQTTSENQLMAPQERIDAKRNCYTLGTTPLGVYILSRKLVFFLF